MNFGQKGLDVNLSNGKNAHRGDAIGIHEDIGSLKDILEFSSGLMNAGNFGRGVIDRSAAMIDCRRHSLFN